jgi:3-hydroxyacyl-CoA dehydrogenase
LIEVGNFDDDLARIAEADWVVEVVKEDLAVKQALFARVEPHLKAGAIISSNTSGLSVVGMLQGRGAAFRTNFLVTHFFNPVRYMKLLELVAGPDTDPAVLARMARFGEETLGKGIVWAKDSTNFIANRIGTYGMLRVLKDMQKAELTVEEVDKIFGPPMGRPKSAVFRTTDLVGLDTFVHVAQNCYDTLTRDEERETFQVPEFVHRMVAANMLGDKTGMGFYKKVKGKDGESEIQALDLKTLTYRPQAKVRFDSLGAAKGIDDVAERIRTVLSGTDKAARFAERVTLDTLAYASRRIPEISDDLVNIDRALRWGFAWDLGPFQVWDAYGVRKGVERMKELGLKPAPWVDRCSPRSRDLLRGRRHPDTAWDIPRGPRQWSREPAGDPGGAPPAPRKALKRTKRLALGHGDGALLLEFHSKLNSVDDGIVAMMNRALDRAESSARGLVIGNDGTNFSAGANIMALLMAIKSDDLASVERMVTEFQAVNQRMRYSPIPVVAAPFGLTLGGGAEIALGANALQAAAELYMGLVEVGVGLIPGGGGNMMLLRNLYGPFATDRDFDPLPFLKKLFLTVGTAKVATSAEEARELGFLSRQDGISLNRDLVLADAKARVLGMADAGFRPPRPTHFRLPGRSGAATIDMMLYDMELNNQISAYDRHIGQKLGQVLSGGDVSAFTPVSEARLLELEKEAFLSLCGEEKTQDRIAAMLETGKPLRN